VDKVFFSVSINLEVLFSKLLLCMPVFHFLQARFFLLVRKEARLISQRYICMLTKVICHLQGKDLHGAQIDLLEAFF